MDDPFDQPDFGLSSRVGSTSVIVRRRARPWHRLLGVLLTLPLLWVVITGAPLGHTVQWKLDQRMVTHPWVLSLYGMTPEGNPRAVKLHERWITEWDGQMFLDDKIIGGGSLIGAVPDGEGIAVIAADGVIRLDRDGALKERLGGESLPTLPLAGVAFHDGELMLQNADGWHRMHHDWLEFEYVEVDPVKVEEPSALVDPEMKRSLQRAWSGGGLPLSRIILDLHAGRFLGPAAPYFYDLVAVSTAVLCVSGLILFFRKPRRV